MFFLLRVRFQERPACAVIFERTSCDSWPWLLKRWNVAREPPTAMPEVRVKIASQHAGLTLISRLAGDCRVAAFTNGSPRPIGRRRWQSLFIWRGARLKLNRIAHRQTRW